MTRQALVVRQNPEAVLVELETIEGRLAVIEQPDEAKKIADQAAAFHLLAKRQHWGLAIANRGGTIQALAVHRTGELCRAERRAKNRKAGEAGILATFAKIGLKPRDGERWQEFAAMVTPDEIRERARQATAAGQPFTMHRMYVELLRTQRVERNANIEHRTPPGLAGARFRVLYADPPWDYFDERIFPTGGYGKAVSHYPTMSIEAIAALVVDGRRVRELAADDAVLFLWVTAPKLNECWPVIEAWGFTYKTGMVWDKVDHNFGHYVSARHEHLLIATRGSCLPDRPTPMPDSVQTIRRSEIHSAKPAKFRDLICDLYDGPRLELFARDDADDRFVAWGNEVLA